MLIPIFRTRCIMLVFAVLALLAAPLHIGAQRDFQSVGLVLSGGGAKVGRKVCRSRRDIVQCMLRTVP